MSDLVDRHELRVALEREEAICKQVLGRGHEPLATAFFEVIYRTLNKMPFLGAPVEPVPTDAISQIRKLATDALAKGYGIPSDVVLEILDREPVPAEFRMTVAEWQAFDEDRAPVPAPHLEHVLELRDDGWSLEHPQVCRESKSLLDCPVHSVVKSHEDEMELWEHGRFNVGLDEYDELEKLSSAPPVGTQE